MPSSEPAPAAGQAAGQTADRAAAAPVWTLGAAIALSALSIDLIAPALAVIRHDLGAGVALVGLTIPAFMAGFGSGQLAFGPLSDRYGRRALLVLGVALYAAASLGCVLAPSGSALLAGRFAQGVGAGASVVIAGALIRDMFAGARALAVRAQVNVVYSVAPVLAPVGGALIVTHGGWRLAFAALALCGAAVAAAAARLPSRPAPSRPAPSPPAPRPAQESLLAGYAAVLRHGRFMRAALVNALSFGCSFAVIAGAPLVLVVGRGVSPPAYAALFAAMALGLAAGIWSSPRLGRAVAPAALLRRGLAVLLGASLLALGLGPWVGGFVVLATVQLFARGVVAITAQHAAMEALPRHAGAASAVVGVSQVALAALSSAAVALLFPSFGPPAVAAVAALMAALALAVQLRATGPAAASGY